MVVIIAASLSPLLARDILRRKGENRLFNLQTLVDIAGVAGFVLALWLAVYGWAGKREHYTISVIDYADFGPSTRFFLAIQNNSDRPLVIREISFHGTVCELLPKKIRGEPESWNGVTTHRFPIRVRPHDAEAVFLEFVGCVHSPLIADTWVTFQIQTTAQAGLKTVLLGSKSHYLNNIPRVRATE